MLPGEKEKNKKPLEIKRAKRKTRGTGLALAPSFPNARRIRKLGCGLYLSKDRMRTYVSLGLALALAAPAVSQAEPAELNGFVAAKPWSFSEVAGETGALCRASTVSLDGATSLTMDYAKDGTLLPTIILKTNRAAPLASVKISRKESEPFFLLQEANGESSFWYAPVNFSRLAKLIRDQNSLELFLDPKGAPVSLVLSLAGSGDALRAVAKCLGKTEVPEDFLKALNQEKDKLTPDLGDRSVARLKQATEDAFSAYRAGASAKAALAALRKPVESLLRKEKGAQDNANAAEASRGRAVTRLDNARAEVSGLEEKLQIARAKLTELKAAKPLAEQDLAAKKAVYLPLREQMKPYEAAIAAAQKSEDSFESDIKKNEALITKNERTIRALEAERANLQRAIPGLESEASSLRVQYSQAASDYNSYNASYERQRYLDNETRYRWAKSDLSSKESEVSRAQSDYYSASSKADSIRSQLYSCQAQPNPNCSSLQSDLSSAERERDSLQWKLNSLRSDISSLESDIRRYESDADSKVSSEQSRLRSNRDSYAYALSSKESELASAKGRVAEIRNTVPGLKNQIDRARDALPGLRDKLANATAAVAQAVANRDAYSASIGFGAAEDAYRAAEAKLKEVNNGIAENTKAIPAFEKSLVKAKKEVDPLVKALARAESAAADARAKLALAQEPLKGFRVEEAKILAQMEEAGASFRTNQAVYQDLYAELLGR